MTLRVIDVIRRERAAFADTAAGTDPDAPTLCAGWAVRDLLAHLVIRDRRPDGAVRRVHPWLPGRGRVVVSGEPGELVLHTVGRGAAEVTHDGADDDVAALRAHRRGI